MARETCFVRGAKLVFLTLFALLVICFALPSALAQVSPSPSSSPTSTPTQTPSPSATSTPSPTVPPSPSPTTTPSETPSPSPSNQDPNPGHAGGGQLISPVLTGHVDRSERTKDRLGRHAARAGNQDVSWTPDPHWGTYSTAGLVRVADGLLLHQGWRPRDVEARVFAPFPVAGLAAWTDT